MIRADSNHNDQGICRAPTDQQKIVCPRMGAAQDQGLCLDQQVKEGCGLPSGCRSDCATAGDPNLNSSCFNRPRSSCHTKFTQEVDSSRKSTKFAKKCLVMVAIALRSRDTAWRSLGGFVGCATVAAQASLQVRHPAGRANRARNAVCKCEAFVDANITHSTSLFCLA